MYSQFSFIPSCSFSLTKSGFLCSDGKEFVGSREKETNSEEEEEDPTAWQLVTDHNDDFLKLIPPESVIPGTHKILAPLSENYVKLLGQKIDDEDYDVNQDIYCGFCNQFYRPYCRQHPLFLHPDADPNKAPSGLNLAEKTLPCFLKLAQSKIPGAGTGVFSTTIIPIGVLFGPYKGVKVASEEECKVDGYAWEIQNEKENYFIDGSDPNNSNWLRYINCARHESEQNLFAFQRIDQVYYRTFKAIQDGDELLVWYGNNFGGHFNLTLPGPESRE